MYIYIFTSSLKRLTISPFLPMMLPTSCKERKKRNEKKRKTRELTSRFHKQQQSGSSYLTTLACHSHFDNRVEQLDVALPLSTKKRRRRRRRAAAKNNTSASSSSSSSSSSRPSVRNGKWLPTICPFPGVLQTGTPGTPNTSSRRSNDTTGEMTSLTPANWPNNRHTLGFSAIPLFPWRIKLN